MPVDPRTAAASALVATASLASGITRSILSGNRRRSSAAIEELDETDQPAPGGFLRLQYFPETLSDSKQVNWSPKEIPGGSLPLYQWIASGERVISFQAVFTTDIDISQRSITLEGLKVRGRDDRNVDIRTAVLWLRRFMMPSYLDGTASTGGALTRAPRKLKLYLPNSGIGAAGGAWTTHSGLDFITAIMTACEVEWVQFFPSGMPRIATVQLSFAQIAQYQGTVVFPGVRAEVENAAVKQGQLNQPGSTGSLFAYTLQALPGAK